MPQDEARARELFKAAAIGERSSAQWTWLPILVVVPILRFVLLYIINTRSSRAYTLRCLATATTMSPSSLDVRHQLPHELCTYFRTH